jgi:transposase
MLTDLESVFRCLKSELGLRPVFHYKENRADGHLFITVLAYQAVQVIRRILKEHGLNDRWSRLREILSVQQRVTATFKRRDGHVVHVRKTTIAEPKLQTIYAALRITSEPGGVKKLTA